MKTYLFICSMGEKRSPMAARIARDILQSRGICDVETDYSGMVKFDVLKEKMLSASRIYVMDEVVEETIRDFPGIRDKEFFCLDIPPGLGNYPESLEAKLREVLAKFL